MYLNKRFVEVMALALNWALYYCLCGRHKQNIRERERKKENKRGAKHKHNGKVISIINRRRRTTKD
jgi:hypothetical protein